MSSLFYKLGFTHHCEDTEEAIEQAPSGENKMTALLRAADLCMELLNVSSDPQEKKKLRQTCLNHLNQAERLKIMLPVPSQNRSIASNQGVSFPILHNLREPVSSRILPTNEKIVLLRGSKLHGCIFHEWTSPPTSEEFIVKKDESKFE